MLPLSTRFCVQIDLSFEKSGALLSSLELLWGGNLSRWGNSTDLMQDNQQNDGEARYEQGDFQIQEPHETGNFPRPNSQNRKSAVGFQPPPIS